MKSGSINLDYIGSKTHFKTIITLGETTRKHVEYFPIDYQIEEHFQNIGYRIMYQHRYSPSSMLKFNYSSGKTMPTIDQLRQSINDLNPLFLQAGNPNLRRPRKHSADFSFNHLFVANSSSIELLMNYQLIKNYIAMNSHFFTEATYLPEYRYTAIAGATLTTPQNAGNSQNFSANFSYSKLSQWLKSSVKLSLEYQYQKTPSFLQGEPNDWTRNQGSFGLDITSNFSKKIELTLQNSTEITHNKTLLSNSDDIIQELIIFGARSSFIPKYIVKATMRYNYKKQFSSSDDIQNIQLETSISRKVGKRATLALEGYNLLDYHESKSLSKTAEYLFYSHMSRSGRTILLSLKYNF
jgi:outer membrane receptor protein involved in Fe transport